LLFEIRHIVDKQKCTHFTFDPLYDIPKDVLQKIKSKTNKRYIKTDLSKRETLMKKYTESQNV